MIPQGKRQLPGRPGIIFFGTPAFAVPTLRALVEERHRVLAVVAQPDRPKGRGRKLTASPVKQEALESNLKVLQPEKASDPSFLDLIRSMAPDLLLVVAFGQVLKRELLEIPGWGALNIHASLLPKYRGAAPIHWAVFNSETTTGLTAMRMNEGLDTGPILYQEIVPILENETAGELHDRLAGIAGPFAVKVLRVWSEGRVVEREQEERLASYAPKIDRGLAGIDWSRSAEGIAAQIRALDPWPGATTTIAGKPVKLFSARVIQGDRIGKTPGKLGRAAPSGLEIETGDGLLEIGEFQIPGKKRLPAGEFLKGFRLEEGIILGT